MEQSQLCNLFRSGGENFSQNLRFCERHNVKGIVLNQSIQTTALTWDKFVRWYRRWVKGPAGQKIWRLSTHTLSSIDADMDKPGNSRIKYSHLCGNPLLHIRWWGTCNPLPRYVVHLTPNTPFTSSRFPFPSKSKTEGDCQKTTSYP